MKQPSTARHVVNGVAHFDISGPNVEPLRSFYSAVFGWRIDPRGPGYAAVMTPDGSADGAIVESPDAGITIGITVPELARSLERVTSLGGTVIMPPTDNGWVVKAQILDPAGNRVTLIAGSSDHQ
jgi:predicted enzyme related to lactoylglutathione lyase